MRSTLHLFVTLLALHSSFEDWRYDYNGPVDQYSLYPYARSDLESDCEVNPLPQYPNQWPEGEIDWEINPSYQYDTYQYPPLAESDFGINPLYQYQNPLYQYPGAYPIAESDFEINPLYQYENGYPVPESDYEINPLHHRRPVQETHYVKETRLVPETHLVPETKMVPETHLVPEVQVRRETHLVPETKIIRDTQLVPHTELVPETHLVPATQLVPETFIVPITTLTYEDEYCSSDSYITDNYASRASEWIPDWIPDRYPYPETYPYSQYYPDYSYDTYISYSDYQIPARFDVPARAPVEDPDVFPKGFSFGVSSGAYNIEGAWTQDCKSESIWDRWLHTYPGVVQDGSNGDISADAYNHLKEDVEILNNLTARHYKFSISWPSIINDGCGQINQAGIDHYKRLIHLLKINQIEPIVTMYDSDLPQALQDQGGFLCSSFPEWYTEYARVLFDNFGDDVKYWITFNDPTRICKGGYGDGTFAPGISDGPGNNEYVCGRNLLLAHATAYHLYDENYRSCQKGKISIALASDWYEPLSSCDNDRYAAETKLQFQLGWWAHPIYIGDYPSRMIERIRGDYYHEDAYNYDCRLPLFSHSEVEFIKDTHDFFALNYDSSYYTTLVSDGYYPTPCYEADIGAKLVEWEGEYCTLGIRKLIQWIQRNYYNPSIFITGNGYGTCSRDLNDDDRIDYIKAILRNVRAAVIEDDARVYGYSYYAYIDGFEWLSGYSVKYGLYDVEFDCPEKTRTARKSAAYYQHLASTGCIDEVCPRKYYF